jgi:dihydroxy-acid dehydratase
VVHLPAVAGRLGIELPLALFDEISRRTPLIANLRPTGKYQMEDLFHAGGIPAVLNQLLPLLHGQALTVTGLTLRENVEKAEIYDPQVIRPLENPLQPDGGLAVLFGNLAPGGAVIKHAASSPGLLRHRGPAKVFRSLDELNRLIDDPDLDVSEGHVLVLQNAGPLGGPGMPEVGHLPIPGKLLKAGVRDMLRISDARISGTSFGALVVHVAPESAVGGPLGLVQDGDLIEIDIDRRRLQLHVDEAELERRRSGWVRPEPAFGRGYGRLYLEHVTQAPQGCDFDFLLGSTPVQAEEQPKF